MFYQQRRYAAVNYSLWHIRVPFCVKEYLYKGCLPLFGQEGENRKVNVPDEIPSSDQCYALESHHPTSTHETSHVWPCFEIILSVFNKGVTPNLTPELLTVKRHEHFCHIRPVIASDIVNKEFSKPRILAMPSRAPNSKVTVKNRVSYCSTVQLDSRDNFP